MLCTVLKQGMTLRLYNIVSLALHSAFSRILASTVTKTTHDTSAIYICVKCGGGVNLILMGGATELVEAF